MPKKTDNPKNRRGLALTVRILVIALTGLFLGVSIFMINADRLRGMGMPMPFGVGIGVVLTGSMEPALHANDLILVRRSTEYAPGDIVVYHTEGMQVVHRVVSVGETELVTRGDANNADDDPVPREATDGAVFAVIPGVGAAVRVLQQPLCAVAILVLALLLLERSFRKEKEEDSRSTEALKEEIRRLKAQKKQALSQEQQKDKDKR